MTSTRTSRRPLVLLAAVAGVAALAWLAFGYFGVQTLFVDDEVDEALPEFDSGAGGTDAAEAASDDESTDAGSGDGAVTADDVDTSADDEDAAEGSGDAAAGSDGANGAGDDAAAATISTLVEGSFIDRSHPTSGVALVLTDGTEQRFLRLEDFQTDNGPDLNVYLSTAAPDAPADQFDDDFVDLGDLSGNVGNQNYELPADVDLERYRTVVIWCVRFGVAFGAAELEAA